MPGTSDSLEFVELHNPSDTSQRSVSGFYFDEGIQFEFPFGLILDPDQYVIVAKDSAAFQYTFGYPAFQWTSGNLADNGGLLLLRNNFNAVADSVPFSENATWPAANGNGKSIVLCTDSLDNAVGSNWQAASGNTGISINGTAVFANPGTDCSGWVGLTENRKEQFAVFPNPNTGAFTIGSNSNLTNPELTIFDVNGKAVFRQRFSRIAASLWLDSSLKPGVYVIQLESGQTVWRNKLLIVE